MNRIYVALAARRQQFDLDRHAKPAKRSTEIGNFPDSPAAGAAGRAISLQSR